MHPVGCASENHASEQTAPENASDTHSERPLRDPHIRLSFDTFADTNKDGRPGSLTLVTEPDESNLPKCVGYVDDPDESWATLADCDI
jgi:hypothetical protein